MKLITRQMRANEAAASFAAKNVDNKIAHVSDLAVVAKLRALGPAPDPDAVDAVLGMLATEVPGCDECGAEVPVVVQVGEEESWESATAHLCRACLARALAMIDGTEIEVIQAEALERLREELVALKESRDQALEARDAALRERDRALAMIDGGSNGPRTA